MRFTTSRTVKTVLATAVATSALVVPAAGSATAATTTGTAAAAPAPFGAAADTIDAKCRSHGRNYVVRQYYRGPGKYTLRCGTKTWGWKHIKLRHGWNSTMDRKISAAIWSGAPNGRGGFSTYTNQCPSIEKFRTIIGTPAGRNDLLTAYKVNTLAAAGAKC
ncbi:hypothetical protein [Streptomyces sp. NPDC050856]|uniref:hypothetical protein n=1 Tax=Streptomyces sp. NPDC050856 TaxID=3154939 RepID=UPI0033E8A2E0